MGKVVLIILKKHKWDLAIVLFIIYMFVSCCANDVCSAIRKNGKEENIPTQKPILSDKPTTSVVVGSTVK